MIGISKSVRGTTPLGWMAHNHVAANLLMLALIIGGLIFLRSVPREVFPAYVVNQVDISMSYPGASPQEVEQSIILPIENELQSVTGIKEVRSYASEGRARLTLELEDSTNPDRTLQYVRNAVSRVQNFPGETEPARITLKERAQFVLSVAVFGDLSQQVLFDLAQRLRFEILDIEGVSQIVFRGLRSPEIAIEVPQQTLRGLDLTLADIAGAVRVAARDVPGGEIDTADGEFLLRTEGRRERGMEFKNIPLKSASGGAQIRLGDIAQIYDDFEESDRIYESRGQAGIRLDIFQSDGYGPIIIAENVAKIVQTFNQELPDTVTIRLSRNAAAMYQSRMGSLTQNGVLGLCLVILCLGLFLNLRLAFWVAISIPVVFIGTFLFLPTLGVTINMISMFAFIMTLGIVVDDAIIVGENIYSKIQEGLPVGDAVRDGVNEMFLPVLFAVITNIIAFLPLMFVPGESGQFLKSLPIVACVVFGVSLVEALLILPAHLNYKVTPNKQWSAFFTPFMRAGLLRERIAHSLDTFRDGPFARMLDHALSYRYVSLVIFTGLAGIFAAWVVSGRMDVNWNPQIPGNKVDADLVMPADVSLAETEAIIRHIEEAGLRTIDRLGGRDTLETWSVRIGMWAANRADVSMTLVPEEERNFTQLEFLRAWRDAIGPLTNIKSLTFDYLRGPGSSRRMRISLSHPSNTLLESAAHDVATILKTYKGVVDVTDGVADGKRQFRLTLTPEAHALGLSENTLGRQVRNAFFGAEALRILRDAHEVKVMVRLPREERVSAQAVSNLIIRAPGGIEIPLAQAANIELNRAFTGIQRIDGQRSIVVNGTIDPAHASARRIKADLTEEVMPLLTQKYPGLHWSFVAGYRSGVDPFDFVIRGLGFVLIIIFALVASLFRSYVQGMIVMLTVPYAISAAIAGHILMGYDISSVSIFGMIALAGLVVNGALVLTWRYNQYKNHDICTQDAAKAAAINRFRPILLTSLTTTVGLLPMLFETSSQSLFLVPMAIALSFGTVASTFIVLLLIPALHLIHEDIRQLANGVWRRNAVMKKAD